MPPPAAGDGGDGDEQLFAGVRFVLVGFDSVSEAQYRSEMVRRGGAEAGRYDAGCTHVVVCGRVYDDPVCVAARKDGKALVTELWADDSLDLRALADAERIIYRPVRDLNGIPGSESLHICLTGYQRNGREDIMKMVSLMGAQFSKPLIANQVTHLICYKFEGEKYELAKKVNIKLVNHRWLEDCLKAWAILPIDNYTKSGWELEILEAEARDSEDEAEDVGRRPFDIRASVRSTPSTKNGMKISADPDVHAPSRTPIIPSGNGGAVAGRHLNNPNRIIEDEAEDVGRRALDNRADVRSTPNTKNGIKFSLGVLAPIRTPTIPSDNRETVAGRHLNNPDQISVTNNLFTTPSRETWYVEALNPSNVSNKEEDKRDDGAAGDRNATADGSNVEDKLILCEANLKSGGNAAMEKIRNLSYSRKHPRKSVSPEGPSAYQITSPQRTELRADCNVSPVAERGDQKISEFGDVKSPKDDEMIKYVDGSGSALAQKRKSFISSVSPKLPNGVVGSATGVSKSPFVNEESAESEPATISSLENNFIESTKADSHVEGDATVNFMQKRQSGSSKSKVSSYRKTSLKRVRPVEGVKLPEHSANGKNVDSPGKAKALDEAMTENTTNLKCAVSPASTAANGKRNSVLSLHNEEMEEAGAQLSVGNALSRLGSLLIPGRTRKSLMKDKTPKKSLCSSKNSKLGSRSGNTDIIMTDAPVLNKSETVASKSVLDKVVSHENIEKEPKMLSSSASAVEYETRSPKKVPTTRVRNAVAKRSRNVDIEMTDAPIVNKNETVASKSVFDRVVSQENAETDPKKLSSSASADEYETRSPKKVPTARVRNAIAKRSRNADIEMTDVPIVNKNETVASKTEFDRVVSQENAETDPKKLSSTASADEYECSPKKVPTARLRNSVAKRSRNADIEMIDAPIVNKTETVTSKSKLDKVVPSENVETDPKKLSSTASTDDYETSSPKKVPNTRVRNAVAKKKMKVGQHKFAGGSGKNDSVSVSTVKADTSKRTEENSRNVDKVNADQELQKATEDGMKDAAGSFCKDVIMVDKSEVLQNSKSRSSKRNKTVHLMEISSDPEKENRPDHGNVSSKSKGVRNDYMISTHGTKSVQNGEHVLGEHSKMIQGNGYGTMTRLEPAWFILSGHRLQRRDYRSILRSLKGRVCRDSHHWSFQATHFIAPDPLRRTEKFFAAAAAGRWILKTDYLTACNEAGKFLEEEPFEWFGNGLNDRDTISLEAPRKWRLLREQTGHGAFFGIRIIVYGQCISPSLDTLKRAVKAGDGTILATSPPYTRFLKSGVDFAVVSASMPSADAWVQEFGRHDIPCVSADYLVEYVCKPGYPLKKHVLFKTHDLAEKSLEKLLKDQREVIVDPAEPSEESAVDLSCSVCGSNDREDVMLICGDEDGATGCGIGAHIDCCDPPLEAVPECDWLCPKCDITKAPKAKRTKSRASKLR